MFKGRKANPVPPPINHLPLELLIQIFHFLPEPRNNLSLVCRAFAAAAQSSPVTCRLLLTLCKSATDALPTGAPVQLTWLGKSGGRLGRVTFGSRPKGLDDSDRTVWAAWPLHLSTDRRFSRKLVLGDARLLLQRQLKRRVIIVLGRLELATRSNHSIVSITSPPDETVLLDDQCWALVQDMKPNQVTIHNPPSDLFHTLPAAEAIQLLDLTDIHTQLDLTPLNPTVFRNLKHLYLTSDGRLERGIIRATSLLPLSSLQETLETLEFDGPWLHEMIDDVLSVFRTITTLQNLTTLMIDFEPRLHTPHHIAAIVRKLPNLRSLGRLGFVDRDFWRLLKSHEGSHLKDLTIGTRKEPFENRLAYHPPGFLGDLALGLLIVCPNVETLTLWMGFHGNLDELLSVIKRVREGGIKSDPERRSKLCKVVVYQAIDVGNLNGQAWRLGVGRSMQVELRTGAGLGNFSEEVVRFGKAK
ncbi:hypothetical protein PhCBS80983_g01100 [Powellomyces hirtus]|uniref:F-box domain-containing protein n=1 Tax=Powellomyces hirtus TaxID=109895 RepID=A0A507EDV2_9FUNG|nr:hypothetical protein PhCBS80983_g01100 [Powellomyces hirtus]